MIAQARLKEILAYDPSTGQFVWLMNRGRRYAIGSVAGSVGTKGYRSIKLGGKAYKAHRLAWAYMTGRWPQNQIDHINAVKDDNRWCNLRQATPSQNEINKPRQKNNSSGYRGVSWSAKSRRWKASIGAEGTRKFLGYFMTAEDAHHAYVTAAETLHGEYQFSLNGEGQ